MKDYILHFDNELAAIDALPGYYAEECWSGGVLPVSIVIADAVYGEVDDDGNREVVSERETRPGFWLLAPISGLVGEVAEVDRATGALVSGDMELAGGRLDPVWAGGEPMLTAAPEA